MRYKRLAPSILLWEEAEVGITAQDDTIFYGNADLNNDIDLSYLDAASSVALGLVAGGLGRGEVANLFFLV